MNRNAAAALKPAAPKLAEGVRVRLKGIRQPATVRKLLSNDLVEVDAGFLRMQVPVADVEEVLPAVDAPSRTHGPQPAFPSTRAPASKLRIAKSI